MKNKLIHKALVGFLILLLLSGCNSLKKLSISEPQGFEVEASSAAGLQGDVLVAVNNPSIYKINVVSLNLDVTVNGNRIGKIMSTDKFLINKKSDETVNIPLRFRFLNPMTGALTLLKLANEDEVDILLEGELVARTGLVKKKIPIKEEKRVNLKDYLKN